MPTEKQIQAARANGAKSRGPTTPEGKRRSSQNALKHGLLSRHICIPGEDPESFDEMVEEYRERFLPKDPVEDALVEELAVNTWRQRRLWAVETEWMSAAFESQQSGSTLERIAGAVADVADTPRLALLHRYETRLQLAWQRTFKNLIRLRSSAVLNEPGAPLAPVDPHVPNEPDTPPPAAAPEIPNEPNASEASAPTLSPNPHPPTSASEVTANINLSASALPRHDVPPRTPTPPERPFSSVIL